MPDQHSHVYDVHLYAVARLKVGNVEAATHRQAIEFALAQTDLHASLANSEAEYAEELSHFLVDVVGNEDYSESKWFNSQSLPCLANLARLIAWYDGGQNESKLAKIIEGARDMLANSV